ncbi:hypothetical protein COV14_03675 [Candidatus Woesearchaeota archaeon CG10_big_fil_rev_8_21_14_0_10_33_12]|nr:MAG: hypothetical protein COV14_03675 [Candidatus Woesearchaeota archaeon CG10_big_fil_rev_8_21_14_0_10_33_12]
MSNKEKTPSEKSIFSDYAVLAFSAALFTLSIYLFGLTGFKTIGFWFIFYIVPSYFILKYFGLDSLESFVFSVFITAGILPALVFFLNLVVPSLIVSAVIIFITEVSAVILLYKNKK